MKEQEIEFKNLLSKDEYAKLIQHFKSVPKKQITQTNIYLDTPDFKLKEKKCGLRIRTFASGNHELTLKTPLTVGLLETTDSLAPSETKDILAGAPLPNKEVTATLKSLNIQPQEIVAFGELHTNRVEFPYASGLLVLDHSHYLNKEDYEIEFEVTDAIQGELEFQQLLTQLDIQKRPTLNKVVRFYNTVKNQS
ncbi:Adenylate cyclase [Brachybacterium faecium]|nr:Adenylate cyclase [Brachybacterium faecium]